MTDSTDIELVDRTVAFYQPETSQEQLIGVPIPVVTQRQCKVCNHPDRIFIENATHAGLGWKAIVDRLPEDESDITYRNIYDHFRKGHVPVSKTKVLDTLWKRAAERGISPEEYSQGQDSHIEALDLVVDKFLAKLQDPEFEPTMPEGLRAIQLLAAMRAEGEDGTFSPNDMFVALSMFMKHVQTVLVEYLPTEQKDAMADLRRLLEHDPILQRLVAQAAVEEEYGVLDRPQEETEEPAAIEAEVIQPTTYIPPEEWPDDPDDLPVAD